TCLATGADVSVLAVGGDADGYHWTKIASGGVTGWVADTYLRGVAAASPDAQPAPAAAVAAPPPPPPAPPITLGRIVNRILPDRGPGLIVFGGGNNLQLVNATGCDDASPTYWATFDGEFVTYVSGAAVGAVNAPWNDRFGGNIPPGTALIAQCSGAAAPAASA